MLKTVTPRAALAASLILTALLASPVYSHCQIPCGIYDDPARFKLLAEHITTMEKSMKQINELSKAEKPDYNQITRWVMNKESHADELSEIVTYYFMTERLKPTDPSDAQAYRKYIKELTLCHQLLVNAMKAKQTTDLAYIAKLRKDLAQFKQSYLGEHDHDHDHDHGHGHKH